LYLLGENRSYWKREVIHLSPEGMSLLAQKCKKIYKKQNKRYLHAKEINNLLNFLKL